MRKRKESSETTLDQRFPSAQLQLHTSTNANAATLIVYSNEFPLPILAA